MRNLDHSKWFQNAYLSNVSAEKKGKNKFNLTLELENNSVSTTGEK